MLVNDLAGGRRRQARAVLFTNEQNSPAGGHRGHRSEAESLRASSNLKHMVSGVVSGLVLAALLTGPSGPLARHQGASSTAEQVSMDPDALPVDLDKIQRAVSQPPAIRLETLRPVFRVEIFARKPTIEDILGADYLKGPAPMNGSMTHQEFLNLVTPKDVQGYAAFSNKQALTVAATSVALQWALRQAIQKFKDAKAEREREAARREVEEALAALRKARREAGLPDK
jgi:hypothetical protein